LRLINQLLQCPGRVGDRVKRERVGRAGNEAQARRSDPLAVTTSAGEGGLYGHMLAELISVIANVHIAHHGSGEGAVGLGSLQKARRTADAGKGGGIVNRKRCHSRCQWAIARLAAANILHREEEGGDFVGTDRPAIFSGLEAEESDGGGGGGGSAGK